MSEKTTRRAARSLGGMVMEPPITRDDACEYVKAGISSEAWASICRAFAQYGYVIDDLKASRVSKSKDPKKASWSARQQSTVKALDAALDRVEAARKHREFLHEASENYSIVNLNRSAGADLSAARLLDEAYQKISAALVIIERAKPQIVEVPTEATARAKLVRAIADALAMDGIEARASTGFDAEGLDGAALLSNLTPFEQLLDVLGIGEEMTINSFSRFVRSAITGKKGG